MNYLTLVLFVVRFALFTYLICLNLFGYLDLIGLFTLSGCDGNNRVLLELHGSHPNTRCVPPLD